MKVWVLYEGNDNREEGELFRYCHGVFLTKEKALATYENIEYLEWETEYEDDLEKLCNIIDDDKEILATQGKVGYYSLFEVDFKQ